MKRFKWSRPQAHWVLVFWRPGCKGIFSNARTSDSRGPNEGWNEDDIKTFLERNPVMTVVETVACDISSAPISIPHKIPSILRLNIGEDFPRYRVYALLHTWEIVDRDYYDSRGNPCIRSTFRNKLDWSAEDIYSFVNHLNNR